MILTRSIRRKLVIGLALVFAMLVLLSVAGLSALYAYWTVVDNLRFSRDKEPRLANLTAAVQDLNGALIHHPLQRKSKDGLPGPPDELELVFNGRMWPELRQKVDDELLDFYTRQAPNQDTMLLALKIGALDQIKYRLKLLDDHVQWCDIPGQRDLAMQCMVMDVGELQTLVRQIPASASVIDATLHGSGDAIEWRLWLIGGPTAIVMALFFSLIYFGYYWILVPIRQLHEAASRVANGDFSYRLKLCGKDEMVELADMFNKMTARFQTDKAKLGQEVEERSRAILRNERLAGIGFFASGIAHEINNPLQAIGAAAEALTSRLSDGSLGGELPVDDQELLATYLGMIERESTRCQQITSRVLDFARGTNGPKTRQDLTKIVNEVMELVTHMSKFDNCKIVFDRSRPHPVDVSAAEMKQVVLNLVANGLEAMNGTGTLIVEIADTVDEVVLTVQDNGCGMTAKVLENLYEPFFTEKQNGKGTGLGLSITHRIVGDHGGRIEATSEGPGRGSTFRVHLPRCANPSKISAA